MFNDQVGMHEMVLERDHPSGAEEWYCPLCGRRLLMHWPPFYKKIVLEPGDETAVHCHGRNGTFVEPQDPEHQPGNPPAKEAVEDDRLAPYLSWMEQVDFDKLWNGH